MVEAPPETNPVWASLAFGGAGAITVLFSIYVAISMPGLTPTAWQLEPAGDAEASPSGIAARTRGVTAELTNGTVTVTRALPALGFRLAGDESLDERIGPGAFTGTFTVTFDPGAVRQTLIGADFQGGQLTVRRRTDDGDEIVLTDAAGERPRRSMSSPITPVSLTRGEETFVYEFVRTDPSVPAALRALWRPMESSVALPLPSDGADPAGDAAVRGRALFQSLRCASCHASGDEAVHARLDVAPAPDLLAIGERARPDWIRSWLRDPTTVKPGTSMPSVAPLGATNEQWIEDLTHFLVARGGPLETPARAPRSSYVSTGMVAYHRVGCFACHGPLEDLSELPGARVATAPSWKTYVPLGPLAVKTTPARLAAYLRDPLAAHPGGLMPSQQLDAVEAESIAEYLIARTAEQAVASVVEHAEPFTIEPERVRRGQDLFASTGCASCHELADVEPDPAAAGPALEALARAPADGGCLATTPAPDVPRYDLDEHQRDDLAAFLRRQAERRAAEVPVDDLLADVVRLRCTACHAFHAATGPEAAIRPYFETIGEADLGDEGRLPPTLTDAGGRLTTMWMNDVLAGVDDDGAPIRARPYLAARMPSYGADVVARIPALLAHAAGATERLDDEPEFTLDAARVGREIVGSGGLACIQCHEIAGRDSTGTPGPDLALMPGRLHYEHFARWVNDPSRLTPGTRMPTFFPDGISSLPGLLGGSAEAQIAAVWSYLSQGEMLALPEGLIDPAGLELVVADEPIVFRTFMKHAGVRAIACGFPEQVHCAFDADRCMITAAWQGPFLSAAGAWAARGGSETNPQSLQWTAPDGPLLTIAGFETTHRFRGYRLDDQRRPIFRYDLVGGDITVRVEEQPIPTTDGALRRHFSFEGPPGTTIEVLDGEAPTVVRLHPDGRNVSVREVRW
ncbi:MAG: c-type cytochrome [Planctomycetes bacterium]|nr:c-type cytochrome [Planctomycetota bacterium]